MPTPDPRGQRLRVFDASADAMTECGQSRETSVAAIWDLAGALVDSLAAWAPIIDRLDGARDRRFEASRAGRLVIECVFDELFDAPACRVLAAAFALRTAES
jgi:hypothetical protein